jgi:Terminase large subunit, T4likevirus-type, N-terminal
MTKAEAREVVAELERRHHKRDPVAFARSFGFQPDPWQTKVLRSQSKRILLNCSRQVGKSTITALVALHQAIFVPKSLTLLISKAQRQSSELFRKVQDSWDLLLRYGEASGLQYVEPRLIEDNRLSVEFENGSRIVSLPANSSTVRGFSSVGLIIEDEAAFVSDELYRSVRPMLAVSGGRLILLSTPFGKRGHFYEEWNSGEGWEKIQLPATECPRISPEFLAEEKRTCGEWWFKQEYLCVFGDSVNQVFRSEDIEAALDNDVQPLFIPDDGPAYRGSL